MQASPIPTVASADAQPYGPVGLVIGTLAIGVLAMLLCAIAAGLVFGVAAVLHGVQNALGDFRSLLDHMNRAQRETATAEDIAFLTKVGLVISLVTYAAVPLAIVVVARIRAGTRWRDVIALRAWNPFRATKIFWAVAGLAFFYNIGASALISWIYPASKDWISTPKEPAWIAGFVLLAVVFAPIAEEMVFRGWLYTSLKRSIGVKAGIAVTCILFALAHWENTHLYALAVLPVGLVLGIIRERTGTITASMTFHAVYNGAASILLVFFGT